jgi:hypothetical protein
MSLFDHFGRQVSIDVEIVAVSQGLGEHCQGAHRGLEFVTDVRHKVGSNGVDARAVGEIIDDCERAAASQRDTSHKQHLLWRTEQREFLFRRLTSSGDGQGLLDRFFKQNIGVAAQGCSTVAKQSRSIRRDKDKSGWHRVESAAQLCRVFLGTLPSRHFEC